MGYKTPVAVVLPFCRRPARLFLLDVRSTRFPFLTTASDDDSLVELLPCHTPTSPFTVCFHKLIQHDITNCVVHEGNEIALYSLLETEQSSYTVSVDGNSPETWPQREITATTQPFIQVNSLLVSSYQPLFHCSHIDMFLPGSISAAGWIVVITTSS
jgi:hypothetical protein